MKVQIYKNLFGFSHFLICVDTKEIFINNSFENINIALICLEKTSIDRKEIWLNKIKGNLILDKDLSFYINEHQESLEEIKKELETLEIILSVDQRKKNPLVQRYIQKLRILLSKIREIQKERS